MLIAGMSYHVLNSSVLATAKATFVSDGSSVRSPALWRPVPPSARKVVCCRTSRHAKVDSSWDAQEAGGVEGEDYLYELGRQSVDLKTAVGGRAGNVDSLFVGGFLGRDGDIASGALRNYDVRSLSQIDPREYHVPPTFLDKFSLHLIKNYLGTESLQGTLPLILGIWGPKGCGKSFQVELCCKILGIEPVIMSSGELENEWAGDPGRLLRARYKTASEFMTKQGKPSCLVIHDLDAACGRIKDTQVTVNNQMVMGTLMNLCDSPDLVSVAGEAWSTAEGRQLVRVPIVITANDLSTLYAPILRDGRMEKFMWEPSREDLVTTVSRMFEGLEKPAVDRLIDAFPEQPLDFYGALKARMHDEHIRDRLKGLGTTWSDFSGHFKNLEGELAGACVSYDFVAAEAANLAAEQQHVLDNNLAKDYMRWQDNVEVPAPRQLSAEQIAATVAVREEAEEALRVSQEYTAQFMQKHMDAVRAAAPQPKK
eukprot:gene22702-27402_t